MSQRLLLTAAGLQNPNVAHEFLRLLGKPTGVARLLFVPTAAVSAEALRMLAKCIDELYAVGFRPEHITVYCLDRQLSLSELRNFDAIYFAGGDPKYLLARVNAAGFVDVLKAFVESGGLYVGVSAGSVLASDLRFLPCTFAAIHCKDGSANGLIDPHGSSALRLTDNQAVRVVNGTSTVFE